MSESPRVPPSDAELRGQLQVGCEALAQTFGVVASPEALLAMARTRLRTQSEALESDAFASAELCLTLACVQGDVAAQAAFDRLIAPHLHHVISGFERMASRDDLLQTARVHLLVGLGDGGPALARYSGRGSLVKWVRVTTRRALINATRRKQLGTDPLDNDGLIDKVALRLADPNRSELTARYHEAFRAAFRLGAGDLSVRERTLIRHVVVDQLTVRQVGRMFDVHHATAARWVTQAYARLVECTREHLGVALADDARGVDDVLSLIKSRLDVSFAAFVDGRTGQ